MRIQVNSDKNIAVNTKLTRSIGTQVNRAMKPFAGKLTRVEVHLSDVNSHKGGARDKRCVVEARPARRRPLTASNGASTVDTAVRGALTKMRSSLQTFFGKLEPRRPKAAIGARKRVRAQAKRGATSKVAASRAAVSKAAARDGHVRAHARKRASGTTAAGGHSPKKKRIHQARRKAWPRR